VRGKDGADDEHHDRHPHRTTNQGAFAAELVDANKQEDAGGDDLDGAVDAGGEERGLGAANADGLEDLGGICGRVDVNVSFLFVLVNRVMAYNIRWSWFR